MAQWWLRDRSQGARETSPEDSAAPAAAEAPRSGVSPRLVFTHGWGAVRKGCGVSVSPGPWPCAPISVSPSQQDRVPSRWGSDRPRAETTAICLTFLAAHPNLKVIAPLCA